jgi:hypothetical protein
VIDWLQLWAGELSNVVLAVFAVGSLVLRRPFTMAYAKDTTPPEHWDTRSARSSSRHRFRSGPAVPSRGAETTVRQ